MSDGTVRHLALAADTLSASAIIASLFGYLPIIFAAVGAVWYVIQIWESHTVQHWVENRRMVRKAKRIARLRAREKVIAAQLEGLESIRAARVEARDKIETAKVEAAKSQMKEETEAEKKS